MKPLYLKTSSVVAKMRKIVQNSIHEEERDSIPELRLRSQIASLEDKISNLISD